MRLHAASAQTSATAFFLDDNYNAVSAAKKAGLKTIGVYDDTSAEFEGEMRALCDGYIKDFSEI